MQAEVAHATGNEIETDMSLDGFGVAIDALRAERIAQLVDNYETTVMTHVDEEYDRTTKWSDHLADKIAKFGGSWIFIILFALTLSSWILWNTLPLTHHGHFDPYPYILLNLVLSFIAAFQAPVIMMSQNRQAARDKREAIIDFAINYKAEQEVDDMQQHLHRIEQKLSELEALLQKNR